MTERNDYTVAISNKTGKSIGAWEGGFRNYDENEVTQYKIDMAESKAVAQTRAEKIHQSRAQPAPAETPEKSKFLVCGNSETGGKTIYGSPFVLSETELAEERRKAKDATDGTWEVIVLHELLVALDE